MPDNTYTLEDLAIEITNFGDFDILVAQLEVKVDENSRLFDINTVVSGGARESMVVQPMMKGYDGGTHIVSLASLDENGEILCESDGYEIAKSLGYAIKGSTYYIFPGLFKYRKHSLTI